jgi:hypothetical protein
MFDTGSEIYDEEFPVGEGAELTVSTISGRIEVRGGEGSTIRLHAVKRGSDRARENTRIETEQDGNRVAIRTRAAETSLFHGGGKVSSVDYDITVPVGCAVRAKAVSADIAVTGTNAAVSVETVSGSATLAGIVGECSITTVSGDVHARQVAGVLSARTTSGDVSSEASQLRSFNFHSVSGDLDVESPLAAGEHYYAKTVSGDVSLRVPGNTGATVQMKTVSGTVTSDLPAQIIKSGRRHWQGLINGGGAAVELTSVSGDLRIRANGGAAADAAAQPAADTESHRQEIGTVLSALEKGEINVEEAMARIKAAR